MNVIDDTGTPRFGPPLLPPRRFGAPHAKATLLLLGGGAQPDDGGGGPNRGGDRGIPNRRG